MEKEVRSYENVSIEIDGKTYVYFMTNDISEIARKLDEMKLECRAIRYADWRYNPILSPLVRNKMQELDVLYSMTFSHGVMVLNFYNFRIPDFAPHIINVEDISAVLQRVKIKKEFAYFLEWASKEINVQEENRGKNVHKALSKRNLSFQDTFIFYVAQFAKEHDGRVALIYKNTWLSPNKRGGYGISKQYFSKVQSNTDKNFRPSKNKVLLLAIGMHLSLSQTDSLLKSAGYNFSIEPSDEIIKDFISRGDFDMVKLESALFAKTGKYLGYKEGGR